MTPAVSTPAIRALLWPGVASAIMCAILVSLGLWQLRRLDEKEALIARVERGYNEAPAEPPAKSDWPNLRAPDYEYRHVRLSGRYESGGDALIYAVAPEGFGTEPGFNVVTPFRLESGEIVMVERGFLPASRATEPARRAPPTGATTITGHLRAPQSRNSFTPADDPARNIWYTRDPAAMGAALRLTEVAPFSLALDATDAVGPDALRPVAEKPSFPNNHLSYAVTWFSLALANLVIFGIYARGVLRRGAA